MKKQNKASAAQGAKEAAKEEVKAQQAPMTLPSIKQFLKRDLASMEQMVIAMQSSEVLEVLAQYFYSKWHNKENAQVKNVNQVEMEFDKNTEANV